MSEQLALGQWLLTGRAGQPARGGWQKYASTLFSGAWGVILLLAGSFALRIAYLLSYTEFDN